MQFYCREENLGFLILKFYLLFRNLKERGGEDRYVGNKVRQIKLVGVYLIGMCLKSKYLKKRKERTVILKICYFKFRELYCRWQRVQIQQQFSVGGIGWMFLSFFGQIYSNFLMFLSRVIGCFKLFQKLYRRINKKNDIFINLFLSKLFYYFF